MRYFILCLCFLMVSGLYSENYGECYLQIGRQWEKYHCDFKPPIFINSAFHDLEWQTHALDCSIVAKVKPINGAGCMDNLFFQLEAGGLLCGRGEDFRGKIWEFYAPSLFSNGKSSQSKIRGTCFQASVGYDFCFFPVVVISPMVGYIQQNRCFGINEVEFQNSEEETIDFTLQHFGDKKYYKGGWIGLHTKYYPVSCLCLRMNVEYHFGDVKGRTHWRSQELFTDGFSFQYMGKITDKSHSYNGIKLKLGLEYDVWEKIILGVNSYYQYFNNGCNNDVVEASQSLINPSGNSIGHFNLSGKYKSKSHWQIVTICAVLGLRF